VRVVTMTEPVAYSERMDIRVEPRLREAIQEAAARYGVKPAEFIRNSLWTALALRDSDDAPAVRSDGARLYVHLLGGKIVDGIYREPTPDEDPSL
jgi:hypothetical protein